MSRKSLYTVRTEGTTQFVVTKLSDDLEMEKIYRVTQLENMKQAQCDCFAGSQQKHCRHKQMVDLYRNEKRVNTGWMYNFDKKLWVEPINNGEE